MVTSDSPSCVKEFSDLIAQYAADVSARNNRAVCLTARPAVESSVQVFHEDDFVLFLVVHERIDLGQHRQQAEAAGA
jgi:hypothetical protein